MHTQCEKKTRISYNEITHQSLAECLIKKLSKVQASVGTK